MDLYSIVRLECCATDLAGKTKDEVLRQLAGLAARCDAVSAVGEEAVYQLLRDREAQGSTGFGDGVALPHARVAGLTEFVVFLAVSPKGVDFDALDRKKCHLLCVILGPAEAVGDHLKTRAAVSRIAGNGAARRELIGAAGPTALYESFMRRASGAAPDGTPRRAMKLFIVILYFEEFLYDVLQLFIQEGIDGATILESSGMGQYISNVPLFAEFIGFMQERKNQSKTIIALVPEDRSKSIIDGIEAITGDLDKKQGAMIINLDVSFSKGSMQMM